jgi:hypothetical protein
MRNAKGRRFFEKLPASVREGLHFERAASWRDNTHVWLTARNLEGARVTFRMRRSTGEIEPLRG